VSLWEMLDDMFMNLLQLGWWCSNTL